MKGSRPKIQFSNLLRNDGEGMGNTVSISAASLLEDRDGAMNRLRRRSLPLWRTNQGRKMSPAKSDKEKPQIIDKLKISRIDFEASFSGRYGKESHRSKRSTHYFGPDQKGKAIKITKKTQMRGGDEALQTMSRSANKRPVFGLDEMNICIKPCLQKKGKDTIFLSVSTNNAFSNNLFNSTSKKKTRKCLNGFHEHTSPGADKFRDSKMEPNVVTLFPRKLHTNQMIARRKSINRMYSANARGWNRQRSITQEIEGNPVCGWEEAEYNVIDEGPNGQNSFL